MRRKLKNVIKFDIIKNVLIPKFQIKAGYAS